ncbi:peptide cleavage/export ABC transporter [Pediococcus stilesii]|uniref:Peptide cleavage/export ABC transporter n=1 Tax=Pediococcus stilesii TaxID=331679 RepID=A0A5R9BU89_9LACO|nr:peptide cleavage/export ABC transporter [Pediococcus stilesii]TLQ04268.1 peptide cleavage/export ABC transporter [Pediococcus stilesii]
MKIKYVAQVDERDCGVAALAMILASFGSRVSLAHLRNLAKTDSEGTTALGLVTAANKLQVKTKVIKTDKSFFGEDCQVPFIAHVVKNKELLHYYTVFKIKRNRILIGDPDPIIGKKWMKLEDFLNEWTGIVLVFNTLPTYKPMIEKKESLFNFLPSLLKNKSLILGTVLFSFVAMAIDVGGSYYFQLLIDYFIPERMTERLTIVSVALLSAYSIQQVLSFFKGMFLVILGQKMTSDVILNYIKHVLNLPMSFFSTRRTGEIVSRFSDANKIVDALASTIISIFLDVWVVCLLGIVLVIQSWQLFSMTLASLPFYAVIIICFVKFFEKYNQETMQSNAVLNSSIIESINGIETIKSLTIEKERYLKIEEEFKKYLKKSLIYFKLDFFQQSLKNVLRLILSVSILWIGSLLVIRGQLTIGQLIAYNALLIYFTDPLQNIINLQTKIQSAKVANNRLNEVYLVKSERDQNESVVKMSNKNIDLVGVSYRYGFGKNVLDNINLHIDFGQKIAVVGMSGSGKSTLVKLIINFYQPTSGTVKIGPYSVDTLDRKVVRHTINYLPQEPHLFEGTILDNLRLGNKEGTSFVDIKRACEVAEIDRDIEKMPMKYDTKLSENEINLSGGQKQRLTIARALLSGADILILDEATSSLDLITEKRIIDKLIQMENKTVIFVAHRLGLAKKVDKVVMLEDGKLIGNGKHQDLLKTNEKYLKLFND